MLEVNKSKKFFFKQHHNHLGFRMLNQCQPSGVPKSFKGDNLQTEIQYPDTKPAQALTHKKFSSIKLLPKNYETIYICDFIRGPLQKWRISKNRLLKKAQINISKHASQINLRKVLLRIETHLKSAQGLKCFVLETESCMKLNSQELQIINYCLRYSKRLERISLKFSGSWAIGDDPICGFTKAIALQRYLKYLSIDIGSYRNLCDQKSSVLAYLKRLPFFKALTLDLKQAGAITSQSFDHLLHGIQSLRLCSLRLDLSKCDNLTTENMESLYEVLSRQGCLKELDLSLPKEQPIFLERNGFSQNIPFSSPCDFIETNSSHQIPSKFNDSWLKTPDLSWWNDLLLYTQSSALNNKIFSQHENDLNMLPRVGMIGVRPAHYQFFAPPVSSSLIESVARSKDSLEKLSLEFHRSKNISKRVIEYMMKSLAEFTKLKLLRLSFNNCSAFDNECFQQINKTIGIIKTLTDFVLEVDNCEIIESTDLNFSLEISNPSIQHLSIKYYPSNQASTIFSKTSFAALKNLTKLSVELGCGGVFEICDLIDNVSLLSGLTSLSLSFSKCIHLKNTNFALINKSLKKLKALSHLRETSIHFGCAFEITALAAKNLVPIMASPHLTDFSFKLDSAMNFEDSGIYEIARRIIKMKNLKNLNLEFSACEDLTNKGIIKAREILLGSESLQGLLLTINKCRKVTKDVIPQIVSTHKLGIWFNYE